jgi:hypothetical protein
MYAPDKKGVDISAVKPVLGFLGQTILRGGFHGLLEYDCRHLGMPGFEVGRSQKGHDKSIPGAEGEGFPQYRNGPAGHSDGKVGAAREHIALAGIGPEPDIIVKTGQGPEIVFLGMEGTAQKQVCLRWSVQARKQFLQDMDGLLIIPFFPRLDCLF